MVSNYVAYFNRQMFFLIIFSIWVIAENLKILVSTCEII